MPSTELLTPYYRARARGENKANAILSSKLFEPVAAARTPLPRARRRRHHYRHLSQRCCDVCAAPPPGGRPTPAIKG